MLSKGQEWDWLGDPFWRVQTLIAAVCGGPGRPGLPGTADRQSGRQFSAAGRPQLRHVLHHHLLRLRRALRCQHVAAGLAAIAVRLRRLSLGPGAVAGRASSRLSMLIVVGILLGRGVDARWLIAAGLLVMAAGNYWMSQMNLRDQPVAGHLAAGGADRRAVIDLRAAQRRGLSCTCPCTCAARRSGCLPCCATKGAASAPRWPDDPRAPRAVSSVAAGREPRSPEPGASLVLRSRPETFCSTPAMRWGPADGVASAVQPARAAGLVAGVLRHLLVGAVLALGLVFLVLLMKRSVAEKGRHAAAE